MGICVSTIRHIEFRKSWSQTANGGHYGHLSFLPKTYVRIFLPWRNTLVYNSQVQYRDSN